MDGRLLERAAELEVLVRAVDDAGEGHSSVVLLLARPHRQALGQTVGLGEPSLHQREQVEHGTPVLVAARSGGWCSNPRGMGKIDGFDGWS